MSSDKQRHGFKRGELVTMMGRSRLSDEFADTIALEADMVGKTEDEIEHTWFALLGDPMQTLGDQYGTEYQEQWEIVRWGFDDKVVGRIRVRATFYTTPQGDRLDGVYTMATKSINKDSAGVAETEMTITKDMFDSFKALAENGYQKRRWFFPAPGTEGTWKDRNEEHKGALLFEVDVFYTPLGQYIPHVKIDLEVPNTDVSVPEFPFKVAELLDRTNPGDGEKIQDLYDNQYTMKNENIRTFFNKE